MEKQISIIIPTYNMEKYLARCLDSLLIPELEQVEVLVINDGSKDRSSEIAHSYAERYPKSIRVIDKENGNYGSCVNRGIQEATGRYLKILDSDDWFDSEVFSDFVKSLPSTNDDVIITLYEGVDENGEFLFGPRPRVNLSFETGKTYSLQEAFENGYLAPAAGQHPFCFNKEIFSKEPIKLFEKISFSDGQWSTKTFRHVNTIRFFSKRPMYKYFFGREGQTMSPKRERELVKDRFLLIWDELNDFQIFSYDPLRYKYFTNAFVSRLKQLYGIILRGGYSEYYPELQKLDTTVSQKHSEAFYLLNNFAYAPHVAYYPVREWRKKKYSLSYRVPFFVKPYEKLVIALAKLKNSCK